MVSADESREILRYFVATQNMQVAVVVVCSDAGARVAIANSFQTFDPGMLFSETE